jgi:hypothetical protein
MNNIFLCAKLIFSIKSQGGTIVASPSLPDCQIIAGSKRTLQINNYIQRGEKDVIDFRYLVVLLYRFLIDCLLVQLCF